MLVVREIIITRRVETSSRVLKEHTVSASGRRKSQSTKRDQKHHIVIVIAVIIVDHSRMLKHEVKNETKIDFERRHASRFRRVKQHLPPYLTGI